MKNYFVLAMVIIICSCGRNKTLTTTSNDLIRIDLLSEAESKISDLSDIASNIDYIPLQTINNSLISRIDKVIITEDKIYLNNRGNEIMCFNKKGDFLFKLSNSGRGPGEYTFITDFDVSSDNKKIILLSLSNSKILIYNNNRTEFLFTKSIDLNHDGVLKTSFVPGNDNILLSNGPWYGTEPTLTLLINLNGDTISLKPNCYKYEKLGPGSRSTFDAIQYKIDDKVCFKEGFSDTIFYVNSKLDKFFPKLILDSHGTVPPPKVRGDIEYAKNHSAEFSSVAIAYEVPRYIFYFYIYKNLRHKIIYDKVTDKKYEIALENALKDDINGGPDFDLYVNSCTNSKFYSSVDALTFKKFIESADYLKAKVRDPKKKEELKRLADSLKETDNPVLIVVTPKR
jgi:hypothetical protein